MRIGPAHQAARSGDACAAVTPFRPAAHQESGDAGRLLATLRDHIARLEQGHAQFERQKSRAQPWLTGLAELDRHLPAQGLQRSGLHDVSPRAYGDQPAIICELVDWARACGFEVTAAGKGMNFEPRYRYSTPDTVWGFFGWTDEEVAKGDFNPKMYNSFTDGTKAAIEMAAVANGTGLDCPDDGLAFPPAGLHDLAKVFRPAADGGRLPRSGLVDIAASNKAAAVPPPVAGASAPRLPSLPRLPAAPKP
mgnify:CR=1 FL=1